MSEAAPRAVVVIDPAFLGDAVFDAALAVAVARRYPEARIGLVLRPPAHELGPFMPAVDRVHVFDKRGRDRGLAGLRRVAAELAEARYDLALVPHPSVRSAALARLAGIPRRRGSARGWLARRALTEVVEVPDAAGFVGGRLRLLGDDGPAPPLTGALAWDGPPAGPEAPIGLVLGSEWATKRWPIAPAAAFVDRAPGVVRVIGAPWERPLFEALRAAAGPGAALEDAHGPGIDALVAAIAGCRVVVAGDTGPLHIARALGVPTVGLFGPTSEAPHVLGAGDEVLTVPVDCRPCSRHGQRRCPLGHHRCLVDLSGARVARAVGAGEGTR